jgi:hypothetical protein
MNPPPQHRPMRKWTILLLAWVIGLCVFGGYLALIIYMAYRWFASP